MYSKAVTIKNPTGLHARPASEFVSKAKTFQSRILIRRQGETTPGGNAKSIILLLSLALGQGETIEILAEGPDEQQAVDSLAALVEGGFGE
jgi:phosphocarrier protein HPr